MGTLFISLLTLVLLLISAFIVLLVLMQRTSQSGGMGAALGGGAAESAFGAETNNILMKGTIYGIVAFFTVALGLYLLYQSAAADRVQAIDLNTVISAGTEEAVAEPGNDVVEDSLSGGTEAVVLETEEVVAESTEAVVLESEEVVAEATEATEAAEAVESIAAEAADALPANN